MRVASLAFAASLSFSTITAFADWKQEGNTWKYQNSEGKYATSTWQWINGKSYCFDSNGNMYTDEPEFNGKKVVNKFMYCILAIFFGGLGLHKFYCRKKEIGLLYLALFWTGIPWAISIIDFIIALTKKADSNGNILI